MFRFSNLLPFKSPKELDALLEEFINYKLLVQDNVPSSIWKESLVVTDESSDVTHHRADVIWHYLSTHKAPDGSFFFSRLSQVAKLVLLIPHSNATEERIFSMVRKNKTAFRPSLDPKGTLSSILTIKLASTEPAHEYDPSKEVLRKAKSATWEYNKTHSKK